MNILITAAATAQAYQLQRLLNTDNKTVFLADSVNLPQTILKNKFIKIPPGDFPSFSHTLLTICLDVRIKEVYPLRRAEVLALAETRQLFDEYGVKLMVPGRNDINLLTKRIKGEIIIKDTAEPDDRPDRGIFIKDHSSSEIQLFVVD